MENNSVLKFHFTSGKKEADEACSFCQMHYGQNDLDKANVHVVLGGDGSVLSALKEQIQKGLNIPVFGLNFGKKGKMCNDPDLKGLNERIQTAKKQDIVPLEVTYTSTDIGQRKIAYAFNEFVFLRNSPQAAHLRMLLRKPNFKCLIPLEGDGVIISTALGSTGYYANVAGGKKEVPEHFFGVRSINTDTALDLLVPDKTVFVVNKKQGHKRPIMIEGDCQRFENISRAVVRVSTDKTHTLLFDRCRQYQR